MSDPLEGAFAPFELQQQVEFLRALQKAERAGAAALQNAMELALRDAMRSDAWGAQVAREREEKLQNLLKQAHQELFALKKEKATSASVLAETKGEVEELQAMVFAIAEAIKATDESLAAFRMATLLARIVKREFWPLAWTVPPPATPAVSPPEEVRPPVPVVRLGPVSKHPSADTLSVVSIGLDRAIFRDGQFAEGSLAAVVPVDAVVDPARSPVFGFLGEKTRIRARRLRGLLSTVLLVEAPPGAKEGDDVAEVYGVTKHVSPFDQNEMRGFLASPPPGLTIPVYEISRFRGHGRSLLEGEEVVVTEKIHGANARIVMTDDGTVHVGSHRSWKKEGTPEGADGDHVWWPALRAAGMVDKVRALGPGIVVYGEVFGPVQDLHYGHPGGATPAHFRAFDLYDARSGKWADAAEMQAIFEQHGIPSVPVLYQGPWSPTVLQLAEDGSVIADHMREGIVIRTALLREEPRLLLHRSVWKYTSEKYLTRKEKAPR